MSSDRSERDRSWSATGLYSGLSLPAGDERTFVAINMVSSVDGRAVVDGGAGPLSSDLDRTLMRRVRSAVDCVLVGAGTLRAGGYDASVGSESSAERQAMGLSAQPLAAVVTATGDLPRRRGFFRVAGQRAIVLTSAAAVDTHRERFESLAEIAEVAAVASAGERLSPSEILDTLRRRYGVRRVLVEGGPSLVGDLLAADAVDQIFLTISPRVVGGDERTIAGALAWISPPRGLSLVSAAAEAGFLFLRYEVRR